jgi:hypothetical protein
LIVRNAQDWPSVFRFLENLKGQPIPKGGMELLWRKPRRSNRQNRYLFGVVYKTLSEALSKQYQAHITPEMVHGLCREYFMPRVDVPGTGKSIPMSTTQLCRSGETESFQDYVLQIQEFAAKKGIYIQDPNEEWYEQQA